METFISWWQHLPEHINPVFLQLGAIQIRYYGLMFLASFLVFYILIRYRLSAENTVYTKDHVDDYMVWAIAGVLIGGRLGYALFYNLGYFIQNPLAIIWPFSSVNGQTTFGISGMSYHGGLVGVIISTIWFCQKNKLAVFEFIDFIIPAIPLGYMLGRIGNFLNGELYGRVTDVFWGMYFPQASSHALRHPSQLYEAFFEGFVLFVFLWSLRRSSKLKNIFLFVYIIAYGAVRFFIEFFREPDAHIGFIFGNLSMGQALCLIMIFVGILCATKFKTKVG